MKMNWAFQAKLILIITAFFCGCAGKKTLTDPSEHYGAMGYENFCSGNFSEALDNYKRAFYLSGKSDFPKSRAGYLFNIGRIYYEEGKIDSCIALMKTVRNEFLLLHDSILVSSSAAFLALSFALEGSIDSSMYWYGNVLPSRNKSQKAFRQTVLARIRWIAGNDAGCEIQLDSAAIYYKKSCDYNSLADNFYYRSELTFAKDDFLKTDSLLKESLAYYDIVKERCRRWKVLIALARSSWCLDKKDAALHYYGRAKQCIPSGIKFPEFDSIIVCGNK